MSFLEPTVDRDLDKTEEDLSKLNIVSPEGFKTSRSSAENSDQFIRDNRLTHHDINFVQDQQNIQNFDPSRTPKIVDVPVEEKLMDALKNIRERDTALQFEQEIHEFLNSSARSIIFPPNLNSYKRMLIHCIAERFGLLHTMTQGNPEERCLLLNKSLEMRIPRPLLVEIHIEPSEMTNQANGVQLQSTYYNSYGALPMRMMPQPMMVVDSAHSHYSQSQQQQQQHQPSQSDGTDVPNIDGVSRPRIMKRQNQGKYADFVVKDPQSWKVPMSAADKEKKYAETKARIFGEDQAEGISITPADIKSPSMTPTQSTVSIGDIGGDPLTRQDRDTCNPASTDDFSQISDDGVALRGTFSSNASLTSVRDANTTDHAVEGDSNGTWKVEERPADRDENHNYNYDYEANDEMREIQHQQCVNESSDRKFETSTSDNVEKFTQPSSHSPEILDTNKNCAPPSSRIDGNNSNSPVESHSNLNRNDHFRFNNGSGVYTNQRYSYNNYSNGSNSPNLSRNSASGAVNGGIPYSYSKGNYYNGKLNDRPSPLSRSVSGDFESNNNTDGGFNSKDMYSVQARDNRSKHTTVDPTNWKDARFIQRDKESEKLDPDFARRNISPTTAPMGQQLYRSFNPIPYNPYSTLQQQATLRHEYQHQIQRPLQQQSNDVMQQMSGSYRDNSIPLYSNIQLQAYPVHGLANGNTNMHYQPVYAAPGTQQNPGMMPQPQWIPVSHPMNGQFFPVSAGMPMAMFPPQMPSHTQFDYIHPNSNSQNPTTYYPPQQLHSPTSASTMRQVISQQPNALQTQTSSSKMVTPTKSSSPVRSRTFIGNNSPSGGLNNLNNNSGSRISPPNARREWQGRHSGGGNDSPHGQGHPRWNNNR